MPNKADMHSLAQDILDSSEARSAGLAALREQAAGTCRATVAELKEAGIRRQAAAAQCRQDSERRRRDLVLQSERLASGEGQRKAACLTWLGGVAGLRQKASGQQRSDLAKVRSTLASQHAALAAGEAARRSELDGWLKQAAAARLEHAHQQKTTLAQVLTALAGAHAEIDKADRRRRSDTRVELRQMSAERKGAREEWQGISATRQARGRAESNSSAGGAGNRAPRPAAGAASGQAPAETAQVQVETPATTSDTGALRDQVFQSLANHPDGTKLVELAQQFGLAHVQMARVVRALLDDNKVEKRDLLYFAI